MPDEFILQPNEIQVWKLLETFFGEGVCKHCGFQHPSIDKYCEICMEGAYEYNVNLIHFGEQEFRIRRNNKIIERKYNELPF
jgi:predicted amidophosphoribosyltransferase